MNNYSRQQYRYFFLSFSIAFFVLSLMFLSLMNTLHPKTPDSLLREPETEGAAVYAPKASDALSVLFMGVTSEEATAGTYILARFDPAGGRIPIIVFPPQTAVENGGKTESLAEIYRYGGAAYTRDALQKELKIPIDRYVRIRLDSFVAAASAIGSVEFELLDELSINRGGAPIMLNKGKQLLDGQKVSDIIRYSGYEGGELRRCVVTGELTAAIVNQRMDICLSTVADNVFEKLINLINTDISYTDFHDRKPAAEFLARMGDNPATTIAVSGIWSDDGELYILSDTFLALITQTMR